MEMSHSKRIGIAIVLAACGAAQAAEPPARPRANDAVRSAPPANPAPAAHPAPAVRAPLDLRIRNIREYLTREQIEAAMSAPDMESNTIVVQGTRLLPMESLKPIPGGLASLWYAAKHPTQAWRIFA